MKSGRASVQRRRLSLCLSASSMISFTRSLCCGHFSSVWKTHPQVNRNEFFWSVLSKTDLPSHRLFSRWKYFWIERITSSFIWLRQQQLCSCSLSHLPLPPVQKGVSVKAALLSTSWAGTLPSLLQLFAKIRFLSFDGDCPLDVITKGPETGLDASWQRAYFVNWTQHFRFLLPSSAACTWICFSLLHLESGSIDSSAHFTTRTLFWPFITETLGVLYLWIIFLLVTTGNQNQAQQRNLRD